MVDRRILQLVFRPLRTLSVGSGKVPIIGSTVDLPLLALLPRKNATHLAVG